MTFFYIGNIYFLFLLQVCMAFFDMVKEEVCTGNLKFAVCF
jgi:hypothetical protein